MTRSASRPSVITNRGWTISSSRCRNGEQLMISCWWDSRFFSGWQCTALLMKRSFFWWPASAMAASIRSPLPSVKGIWVAGHEVDSHRDTAIPPSRRT